jgi:hypothetical protein
METDHMQGVLRPVLPLTNHLSGYPLGCLDSRAEGTSAAHEIYLESQPKAGKMGG